MKLYTQQSRTSGNVFWHDGVSSYQRDEIVFNIAETIARKHSLPFDEEVAAVEQVSRYGYVLVDTVSYAIQETEENENSTDFPIDKQSPEGV